MEIHKENNWESSIPYKCIDLEKIYNKSIEDYAYRHKEQESNQEETYRTEIRRQRDKILYTGGFRRLQDKTQVMSATLTGDHRTRLTHTLEVEQIALSVSDALGLNRDLVSAIALGHDVGHTPFGHAAERTLDKLLKDNGGFHHPIQSIKYLWEKYGDKLINEIYEGILLHDSDMYDMDMNKVDKQLKYCVYYENKGKDNQTAKYIDEYIIDDEGGKISSYFNKVPSTLEAQIVVWADKIAYITHDLEDFLHSSIYLSVIKVQNSKEKELLDLLNALITYKNPNAKPVENIKDFELRNLLRNITTNLIESSAKNITFFKESGEFKQVDIKDKTNERIDEKEENKKKRFLNSLIINFDNDFRQRYYKLREFLDKEYIFSPEVQRSDAKAQKIITSLFNEFKENYKLTPLDIRKKIDDELQIQVEDFIKSKKLKMEDITNLKPEMVEKKLEKFGSEYNEYKNIKEKIITRNIATYISTMSDTYAENMFCNLNASKDNYSL